MYELVTSGAGCDEEAVHDVSAEVDTEADTDDEDVHAGDLDCDSPPMHEPGNV